MSDTLREQVVRVIRSEHRIRRDFLLNFDELTDAALAVATPIIRADERKRLARLAEEEGLWGMHVADWLRAQTLDNESPP